jgi:hypothetical protein
MYLEALRTGSLLYVRYTSSKSSNPNSVRHIKVLEEFALQNTDKDAGGKFRVMVLDGAEEMERHYVVGNTSHMSWMPFGEN